MPRTAAQREAARRKSPKRPGTAKLHHEGRSALKHSPAYLLWRREKVGAMIEEMREGLEKAGVYHPKEEPCCASIESAAK